MTEPARKAARKTPKREAALRALHLSQHIGAGPVPAARVAALMGTKTRAARSVLHRLVSEGLADYCGRDACRVKLFKINDAGLIWSGSFPSKQEN